MSRTSSKKRGSRRPGAQRRTAPRKGAPVQPGGGAFERTFWSLVAGLAVVATLFFLLSNESPPQLMSAEIETAQLTERSGQQLRLFADQPLDEFAAVQVTVTPNTRVTPSVQGDALVVEFEERLRYDTEYVVEVSGVSAPDANVTATFLHRFTTGIASVLYLDRGGDRDEVLRASLDEDGRGEVVYAAPGVQHIAPLEDVLVVARDAEDGSSTLESVLPDGRVRSLFLPEAVRIDDFIVPSSGTLLAMRLTEVREGVVGGDTLQDALGVIDVASGDTVDIIPGPDGAPISLLTAAFVPDLPTLIVHDSDQTLLRVELTEPPLALPIVDMTEMSALSTDGTRVTGFNEQGAVVVNLASAEISPLEPTLVDGELVSGGEAILLSTDLRLQRVALTEPDTGVPGHALVADDGSGFARVVLRVDGSETTIGGFVISPNDEYVAVELIPAPDGTTAGDQLVNGQDASVTTVIVDIQTGTIVRTLEGSAPIW